MRHNIQRGTQVAVDRNENPAKVNMGGGGGRKKSNVALNIRPFTRLDESGEMLMENNRTHTQQTISKATSTFWVCEDIRAVEHRPSKHQ